MENIIEKLNLSIELINKRKTLQEKVNELSQYNDYLNTPQVDFKIYKANNKITSASVFRVISNVMAVIGVIMIISYYAVTGRNFLVSYCCYFGYCCNYY